MNALKKYNTPSWKHMALLLEVGKKRKIRTIPYQHLGKIQVLVLLETTSLSSKTLLFSLAKLLNYNNDKN